MIRSITQNDREVFIRLSEEFYNSDAVLKPIPHSFHEALFDELMRSDTYAECYLFEEQGTVVGYAQLSKTYSREAGGNVLLIEEIYIIPSFRGRGLATEFFDFIHKRADTARFRLEVEPENEGAVKLYKRMGYRFLDYKQMIKGN